MYKIKGELIVFDHNYNEPIINNLLNQCNIIIFSDFCTYESTLKNYSIIDYDTNRKNFKGSIFNQSLNNLPITIKKLFLGYFYNYQLDNLPTNLETLKLGQNYNQSLDYLPESLKILILNNYNYKVVNNTIANNNLPKNLILIFSKKEKNYKNNFTTYHTILNN